MTPAASRWPVGNQADADIKENPLKRSFLAVVGIAAVVALVAGCHPSAVQSAGSLATPSSRAFDAKFETAADLGRFDWEVFHGGIDPFGRGADQPQQWHGDHNMACQAPTTLRDVNLVGAGGPGGPEVAGDMIWFCAPGGDATKGHVMTSTALLGYGQIDFSPKQSFADVEKVCWDQNWTENGGRKWTQVTIIPEALFQSNGGRLDYVSKDLQEDVAVGGLRLTGTAWMLTMLRASTGVQIGQTDVYANVSGFRTDDKARRFHQCAIDQGDGTVRLELERLDGTTEIRIAPGSFPDGPARVILQDVTYDSFKGDLGAAGSLETNTWHWDNIQVLANGSSEMGAPLSPSPGGATDLAAPRNPPPGDVALAAVARAAPLPASPGGPDAEVGHGGRDPRRRCQPRGLGGYRRGARTDLCAVANSRPSPGPLS